MAGKTIKTITICLIGPAKIGADWRMPGWSGEVDDEIADQLDAAGVLGELKPALGDDDLPEQRTFTVSEWEAAIAVKARELAGEAFDGALDKLEAEATALLAELEQVQADQAKAVERADAAERERDVLSARVAELEASQSKPDGGEPAPVAQSTPSPSNRVAKPTSPRKATTG